MRSRFWPRRASKSLFAVLLLIMLLAAIIYFRRPIAIKSIEYLARAQSLQVTCLDFSLDWRLNLKVDKACVNTPLGSATIKQASWQPWDNHLSVDEVKVKHLRSTQVSQQAPTKAPLSLPDSIPKITISSLEIDSFVLLEPLKVSLRTTSANTVTITGDLNTTVELDTDGLSGDLAWRVADLIKFVPQVRSTFASNPALLADPGIQQTRVKTHFHFDGQTLFSKNNIELASQLKWSVCPIEIKGSGELLVEADIINEIVSVNLSGLANNFSLENCSIIQDYFSQGDLPQLSLNIPQQIIISPEQVELAELYILDQRNKNRRLDLTNVSYKTSGEINFQYQLVINQGLQAKVIHAQVLDFHSQGKVSANLTDKTSAMPLNLSISSDTNHLSLEGLQFDSIKLEKVSSQFSLHPPAANHALMTGTLSSSGMQMGELTLAKSSSAFTLTGDDYSDLLLNIDNQFQKWHHPQLSAQTITNQLALTIKQFNQLRFTGDTSIKKMSAQQINFQPITIRHLGQANINKQTMASQHKVKLAQGFVFEVEQQQSHAKIHINQQNISHLQAVIAQLVDSAVVTKGDISASIALTLPSQGQPFNASGDVNVQQASGKYQDYVINNANYLMPLTFNSAGLQLAEHTVHIDSIDVGVMIEQVRLQIAAKDSLFRLQQAQGEIFDGQFLVRDLWLDGRDQRFNIHFENIDLAKIVALQEQPGIQVTGRINGDLPLIMDKRGISIQDGWMTSLKGGKLTIKDNPSFDAVKKQQAELALLENLDFSELKSKVKLDPDGWVFFDFSLKGNNPVKKQSVNFNYTHQENLFTLLESIRLVKSVEETVEQKITQGNKK